MTQTEALKLALEALESNRRTHYYCEDTWYSCPKHEDGCANDSEGDECNCGADEANAGIDQAITAIKAALETKNEPVEFFDWYDNAHWGNEDFKEGCHRAWNAAIKYTTPPQRTWVGLTDEERDEVLDIYLTAEGRARAIEAKLKDKNT
jgi:hypothetical protein